MTQQVYVRRVSVTGVSSGKFGWQCRPMRDGSAFRYKVQNMHMRCWTREIHFQRTKRRTP